MSNFSINKFCLRIFLKLSMNNNRLRTFVVLRNLKIFISSKYFGRIVFVVSLVLVAKKFKPAIYNFINTKIINPIVLLGYPAFYKDVNESLEKSKPEFVDLVPNAMRTSFRKILGIADSGNTGNQLWWDRMMSNILSNLDQYVIQIEDQLKDEVSKTLNDSKENITQAVIRGAQSYLHLNIDHVNAINYVHCATWKEWIRITAEDLLQAILIEVNLEIHEQTLRIISEMKMKLPSWLPQQFTSILPGELVSPPAYIPNNIIERIWKWIQELEVSILKQIHELIENEVDGTEKRLCQITEKRLRESMQLKLGFTGINMLQPL
eukprot:NODE_9_length_64580_cov_1.431941.p25 type:complete len:321 gc:universal NODE_9_length_64580_cov_1.431941:45731-46693(+)